MVMVRHGGKYDFTSIKRASSCSLNMQGTAYNGIKPLRFGVCPSVNTKCWFTGAPDKRSYSNSTAVKCIATNGKFTFPNNTQVTDMIVVDQRGRLGTSGGPLFHLVKVGTQEMWNLAGTASARGKTDQIQETYFVKFSTVMNDFSLTPVFP